MSKIFRPILGSTGLALLIWSSVLSVLALIVFLLTPLFLLDPSGLGLVIGGALGVGSIVVMVVTGTTWWVGLIWAIIEFVKKSDQKTEQVPQGQ